MPLICDGDFCEYVPSERGMKTYYSDDEQSHEHNEGDIDEKERKSIDVNNGVIVNAEQKRRRRTTGLTNNHIDESHDNQTKQPKKKKNRKKKKKTKPAVASNDHGKISDSSAACHEQESKQEQLTQQQQQHSKDDDETDSIKQTNNVSSTVAEHYHQQQGADEIITNNQHNDEHPTTNTNTKTAKYEKQHHHPDGIATASVDNTSNNQDESNYTTKTNDDGQGQEALGGTTIKGDGTTIRDDDNLEKTEHGCGRKNVDKNKGGAHVPKENGDAVVVPDEKKDSAVAVVPGEEKGGAVVVSDEEKSGAVMVLNEGKDNAAVAAPDEEIDSAAVVKPDKENDSAVEENNQGAAGSIENKDHVESVDAKVLDGVVAANKAAAEEKGAEIITKVSKKKSSSTSAAAADNDAAAVAVAAGDNDNDDEIYFFTSSEEEEEEDDDDDEDFFSTSSEDSDHNKDDSDSDSDSDSDEENSDSDSDSESDFENENENEDDNDESTTIQQQVIMRSNSSITALTLHTNDDCDATFFGSRKKGKVRQQQRHRPSRRRIVEDNTTVTTTVDGFHDCFYDIQDAGSAIHWDEGLEDTGGLCFPSNNNKHNNKDVGGHGGGGSSFILYNPYIISYIICLSKKNPPERSSKILDILHRLIQAATVEPTKYISTIVFHGGIGAILSTMKTHLKHIKIQERSCHLLGLLTQDNVEHQQKLAFHFGMTQILICMTNSLPTIISSIRSSKSSSSSSSAAALHKEAMWLLSCVLGYDDNAHQFTMNRGVNVVLKSLKTYVKNQHIQLYGTTVLRILSVSQVGCIDTPQVVQVIVSAMKQYHKRSNAIQVNGCAVLYALAKEGTNTETQDILVDPKLNIVSLVLACMKDNLHIPVVICQCCSTLRYLAQCRYEVRDAKVRDGAVSIIWSI